MMVSHYLSMEDVSSFSLVPSITHAALRMYVFLSIYSSFIFTSPIYHSIIYSDDQLMVVSCACMCMCMCMQMWADILEKARHGGLNVIQTYVFWNAHEPVQGKVITIN